MNAILVQQALEKVPSQELLVVLVGKRVHQLTAERPPARPFVEHHPTESAIDIALREIVQGKITYEFRNEEESNGPPEYSGVAEVA